MEYHQAIWNIHFPESKEQLIKAKKRLIFDEFFIFIAAMHMITSGEDLKEEGYDRGLQGSKRTSEESSVRVDYSTEKSVK